MTTTFAESVDEVRHRSPDEQEELRRVLKHARITRRRAEIAANARESMAEEDAGGLEFTSDTTKLLAKLSGA